MSFALLVLMCSNNNYSLISILIQNYLLQVVLTLICLGQFKHLVPNKKFVYGYNCT